MWLCSQFDSCTGFPCSSSAGLSGSSYGLWGLRSPYLEAHPRDSLMAFFLSSTRPYRTAKGEKVAGQASFLVTKRGGANPILATAPCGCCLARSENAYQMGWPK